MRGITLDRLEVLRKLKTEEGVLRAAGGSKSRQGIFSRQLKELEEACGTPLVDRRGRCLQVNQKGEAVVQRYERLLEEIGLITKADKDESAIRIGGGETALVQGVIPLLGELFSKLRTTLQFKNLRSSDAIRMFRRGELDLVLSTTAPKPLREGECCRVLLEQGYIVVTPKKAAQSQGLFVKTVVKKRLVLLEGRTPIYAFLRTEARKAGQRLQIGALCSTYGQVLEVIERSGLVGVIPSICGRVALERGLMVKRFISDKTPPFQLWILYREDDQVGSSDLATVLESIGGRKI